MNVTFLDRNTVGPATHFKRPLFKHHWRDYSATSAEQTIERLQDTDIAITNKVVIDRAVLEACPQLKYIAVAATGTNVIDIDACRDHNVHVSNVTGYATHAVAEHSFMLMLGLCKQLKAYEQAIAEGQWQASGQFCFFLPGSSMSNLHGKTLGLIGTGGIALATAKLAEAFGMATCFYSPSGRVEVNQQQTVSLNELLTSADVVSIHCPLTKTTEGLISTHEFAQMKANALLINTARGPIVDVDALLSALDNQQISGAGLDVLPEEPPAANAKVMQALTNPQLLITPHSAWASDEAMQTLANQLMQKIEDYESGKPVVNLAE